MTQDKEAFEKLIVGLRFYNKTYPTLRRGTSFNDKGETYPYEYDEANLLFELYQATKVDNDKDLQILRQRNEELEDVTSPDKYDMVLFKDGAFISLEIANLTISKSGVKQFTLVLSESKEI